MQGREPQESQRQKTTYCQEIGPITSLDVQEAMAGIQPPPTNADEVNEIIEIKRGEVNNFKT